MFRSPGRKEAPVHSYTVLRGRALAVERMAIGIAEPPPDSPAWGILMEMVVPKGTVATLFSLVGRRRANRRPVCLSTDGAKPYESDRGYSNHGMSLSRSSPSA